MTENLPERIPEPSSGTSAYLAAAAQVNQLLTLLLPESDQPLTDSSEMALPAAIAAALLCQQVTPPTAVRHRLLAQEPELRQMSLLTLDPSSALLLSAVMLRVGCQCSRFDQDACSALERLAEAGLPAHGQHGLLTILCIRLVGTDIAILRRLWLDLLQRHPWTFGDESMPLLAVMAAPGPRFREMERAEVECYRVLRRRGFTSGPALFASSSILSRAVMPPSQAIERFLELSRMLNAIGFWPMYPPAIALMTVESGPIESHLRHLESVISDHPLSPQHELPLEVQHLLYSWITIQDLAEPVDHVRTATFLAAVGMAVSGAGR